MKYSDATNYMLDNYDAFYLMTKTATMLGTKNSDEYNRDAVALIDFIGKSYDWTQSRIDDAITLILGEMMRVGLKADYIALASSELLDENAKKNMILFEIKGMAIEETSLAQNICSPIAQRIGTDVKNNMEYDSFHHKYEPRLRFNQIKRFADKGNTVAVLQQALMLILGIGCQKDIVSAQRLLQNLLIWGEKSASVILSFLWNRENNQELKTFYQNIYRTLNNNSFFKEWEKHMNFNKAEEFAILIYAVKSFIVESGKKELDMTFADLINCDNIAFDEKLDFIRRYKEDSWLNKIVDVKKVNHIGFTSLE